MIRLATPSDAQALLDIYAPYVRDTTISFETEVPDLDAFRRRIRDICSEYPYLVCEMDGRIVGYAYAGRHMARAAYRYNAEVSVYLSPDFHGAGVARALYECLFQLLRRLGYYNAYAICTVPNEKSMRFHEKCGFQLVGTYHNTGYKFGAWRDVRWYEMALRAHDPIPGEVLPISDLPQSELDAILTSH